GQGPGGQRPQAGPGAGPEGAGRGGQGEDRGRGRERRDQVARSDRSAGTRSPRIRVRQRRRPRQVPGPSPVSGGTLGYGAPTPLLLAAFSDFGPPCPFLDGAWPFWKGSTGAPFGECAVVRPGPSSDVSTRRLRR